MNRRNFFKLAAATVASASMMKLQAFEVPREIAAEDLEVLPPLPEGDPFWIRNWETSMDYGGQPSIYLQLEGLLQPGSLHKGRVCLDIEMYAQSASDIRELYALVACRDVVYLKLDDLWSDGCLHHWGKFKNIKSITHRVKYDRIGYTELIF